MAAWRISCPDAVVRRMDILSGKPSLLVVWTQGGSADYYDLATGVLRGSFKTGAQADKRGSDVWRAFIEHLTAPNEVVMPVVYSAGATVFPSLDGRMRLIQLASGDLIFDVNGTETPLPFDADVRPDVVALDRMLAIAAVIDTTGRLNLFQHQLPVGVFDLGLTPSEESHPALAVADGGVAIFASDGQRLIMADSTGRVRQRLALHYRASSLVCSPDGRLLVVGDSETDVIRVYDGVNLAPEYQRFGSDLLTEAARVGGAPETEISTALGALAVSSRGTLAFALAGCICVTHVGRMRSLTTDQ